MDNKEIMRILTMSRAGLSRETVKLVEIELDRERVLLSNTWGVRPSADFDRQLINLLSNDKRIKNYLWYYSRRRSKNVPLEKELLVLNVLQDKLNSCIKDSTLTAPEEKI